MQSTDFIGAFVIMDMVVRVSDGSLVNVEIQKVPYMFPAQRISCYSSDLVMRQYRRESERLRHENKGMSYKNLKKVYTIVFYENSSKNLISPVDGRMYFHEGKTAFNTGIRLISWWTNTGKKWRGPKRSWLKQRRRQRKKSRRVSRKSNV